MRLSYDPGVEAFRSELARWLDAMAPDPAEMEADPPLSSAHAPAWARAWQARLFEAGWLVPGWPPELGGRHASPLEQAVYLEELARRGLPRTTNPQGLGIVAPSIVEHGTPEQRRRWALPLLRGELTACLGMSEPGAGSDLAGLATRAELGGDGFVVSGQKLWTSGAHHADFCLCFVRTDPEARRHQGISVLIVPMDLPGVSTRPLPHLAGEEYPDFNEVFLDQVEVPGHHLVGPLNGGWQVARSSLGHERHMMWISAAATIDDALARLLEEARRPAAASLADQLASLFIDAQALRLLGQRALAKLARNMVSPEQSLLKLHASETSRRLHLLGSEVAGPRGVEPPEGAARPKAGIWAARSGLPWATRYLASFGNTIAGGTSEIQRNIVAEQVLGLPRQAPAPSR